MTISLGHTCLTLALGGAGALGAAGLGAPAPFLTGPALTVSIAAVAGAPMGMPAPLRHLCFLVIGLGLGAAVTPETLAGAVKWPASLIAMVASVVAIMVVGAAFLRRVRATDPVTAVLAAAPGHLSFVIGLSLDSRADVRFVTVVQSLRVLMLTLLVPAVVSAGGVTGPGTAVPAVALAPVHLSALAVLAAGVGALFLRLAVPAAFLLAGMSVSTLGHATGVTPGAMPPALSLTAFTVMGTIIGTRFAGITLAQIRASAVAALVLTGGSVAVVVAASLAVVAVVGLPLADVVIALAPGGLETMVAMSVLIGADPAFVGFHHVARLFFLSAAIPIALGQARRRMTR